MSTLIIIPAYNEAKKIKEVVSSVKKAGDWDILVVDDGSADDTASQAILAGALLISHRINRGQGAALKTGIDYANRSSYDTAVFFDADGQMSASEINHFIEKLDQGYQVVLGSRNLGQTVNMPAIRRLVKKLALIFTRLTTGLNITDTHIGFQAWRVDALKKITLNQDRMAHASQLLAEISRHKLTYAEIPVTITYTDYSLKKGQNIFNSVNVLWDLLIK